MPEGTYAIALTVPGELELRALARDLERAGARPHLIVEDDEPYTGQAVALGIPPADRRILKRHLSKLPLLK
jgi:hypothetical protein